MQTQQQTTPYIQIRPATPEDCTAISDFIIELAEYEKLRHKAKNTPEKVQAELFGEDPVAKAMIAEVKTEQSTEWTPVGFALYFRNFSTFECSPGIYLEDLYIQPKWRGYGIGKQLLIYLANIAIAKGYPRFEWSVLDWNQPAIDFYQSQGAVVMEDWRICRVEHEALQKLASQK